MSSTPPQMSQPGEAYSAPKKRPVILWILAALCLGGCLCVGLLGSILFPVFAQAREAAEAARCQRNLGVIGTAMIAYEQDRGAFPQKMSDVESYAPSRRRASYKCPKIDGRGFGRGYAYNKAFFNGKKLSSISKKDLETHPLLVEVQNPEEDVLSPKSMFAKRHMAGRWANAFYVGRGAIRLHLADEQASRPIVAFQREALPETAP